jgi:hypothetical protein
MADKPDGEPRRRWRSWVFALLLFVVGAGLPAWWVGWKRDPNAGLTPAEAKILAIVRESHGERDDLYYFEKPTRRYDGTWTVVVWRRPLTPGGCKYFEFDSRGNCIKTSPGL